MVLSHFPGQSGGNCQKTLRILARRLGTSDSLVEEVRSHHTALVNTARNGKSIRVSAVYTDTTHHTAVDQLE